MKVTGEVCTHDAILFYILFVARLLSYFSAGKQSQQDVTSHEGGEKEILFSQKRNFIV